MRIHSRIYERVGGEEADRNTVFSEETRQYRATERVRRAIRRWSSTRSSQGRSTVSTPTATCFPARNTLLPGGTAAHRPTWFPSSSGRFVWRLSRVFCRCHPDTIRGGGASRVRPSAERQIDPNSCGRAVESDAVVRRRAVSTEAEQTVRRERPGPIGDQASLTAYISNSSFEMTLFVPRSVSSPSNAARR